MHFSTGAAAAAAAAKRTQLAAQGTILEETTGRRRTQCTKGSTGDRTLHGIRLFQNPLASSVALQAPVILPH